MSWSQDAIKRAGSHEARYAIMAKVTATIGDRPSGEASVEYAGQTYRVTWSRLVCPSIF